MESNTRKRPKSKSKPSRRNPNSSLLSLSEPSPDFFPSKSDFPRLFTVLVIASLVAVACNYVFQFINQQPKPFCDNNLQLENSISDDCEPCPRNGDCRDGILECAKGYRVLGRLCVEDGDALHKAKTIAEIVVKFACEVNARSMCDGAGVPWLNEVEMWNDLGLRMSVHNLTIDESIFSLAKEKAVQLVSNILEMRINIDRIHELKCPDSLAEKYKPHGCRVREWSFEHASILMPVSALIIGCILLLRKYLQRRMVASRVEELYQQVCDTLEENALMSRGSDENGEPWVVASWLRDHLLHPQERKDSELWKKVEALVQEDSRLDRYPKLVKGEAKVVWEWQVAGGSLSSSRKKKKKIAAISTIPEEDTPSKTVVDQPYGDMKITDSLYQ